MSDITAIILTKNEEKNIGACIDSIQSFVKRVVVIDSFSDDATTKIAVEKGAEVIQRKFDTHARQFKYAVAESKISTKWILKIDADEWFTPESAEELSELCDKNENTDVSGIILRFVTIFLGKKIKHGGMYPWKKLSVYKTGKGDIEDRQMDEHIYVYDGRVIRTKTDCLHMCFKSIDFFIQKSNWYASKEVLDYYNQKLSSDTSQNKRFKSKIKMNFYYKLPIGFRAWMYYFYRFYIRFGFLDGKVGKIYHFLQAYWYRFLIDAKIYEHEHMQTELENVGELNTNKHKK